jgi:CRISPR-associated protein Cas2
MLELAPGVYTSPEMTAGVRERVWAVCCEWAEAIPDDGGILMTWKDVQATGNQSVLMLGWPKKEIVDLSGLWLDRRPMDSLTTE